MPGSRGGMPIPGFMLGFPALVAVLALGFGLPLLWQAKAFVDGSVVVEAEVTDVRSYTDCSTTRDDDGRERETCSDLYYPTVRYRTITGVAYENEVMGFLNDFDAAIGERIDVRYLRDEPLLVQVDRWGTIWGIPVALTAAGVAFGAFFVFLVRVNARAGGGGRDHAVRSRSRTPLPRWVVAVTLVGPFLLTLMTGLIAADAIGFWQNSEPADAEVVTGMQTSSDAPVMRFTDRHGTLVEGQPETVPFEMLNVPGRKVPVLYRIGDPHAFRAAPGALSLWWDTIIIGLFAAVFSLAFIGGLVFMSRH